MVLFSIKKAKKIGIFLKWKLYIKGKIDGQNDVARPGNIDGKYYTPYINRYMTEFSRIENEKFTSIIEGRLKALNQSINNLKRQPDDVILNTRSEIGTLNREIAIISEKKALSTSDKAIIGAKENEIMEILRNARNKINETNRQGIANLGEANELIKNFNADFIEELSFCREKLAIYWDSFFTKCKKRNPNTDINGQLPTEGELIAMYNIKNPSSDFKIESYNVITLHSFEDNE